MPKEGIGTRLVDGRGNQVLKEAAMLSLGGLTTSELHSELAKSKVLTAVMNHLAEIGPGATEMFDLSFGLKF